MKLIKSGELIIYSKGFLSSKWKENYFRLYDDSTLIWYEQKNNSKAEDEAKLVNVEPYICVGKNTLIIPTRPKLPQGADESLLICFPKNLEVKQKSLTWLLFKDENELREWAGLFRQAIQNARETSKVALMTPVSKHLIPSPRSNFSSTSRGIDNYAFGRLTLNTVGITTHALGINCNNIMCHQNHPSGFCPLNNDNCQYQMCDQNNNHHHHHHEQTCINENHNHQNNNNCNDNILCDDQHYYHQHEHHHHHNVNNNCNTEPSQNQNNICDSQKNPNHVNHQHEHQDYNNLNNEESSQNQSGHCGIQTTEIHLNINNQSDNTTYKFNNSIDGFGHGSGWIASDFTNDHEHDDISTNKEINNDTINGSFHHAVDENISNNNDYHQTITNNTDIDYGNTSIDSSSINNSSSRNNSDLAVENTNDVGSNSKNDTGFSSNDTGSSSNDTGTSSNDTGSSSNDTGTSSNDTGSSSYETGSSSNDTGSISNDTGSSSNDTGSSSNDTGSSSYDTGSSSYDTGSSSYDTGSSSYDTGSSSYDTGSSSYDTGTTSSYD